MSQTSISDSVGQYNINRHYFRSDTYMKTLSRFMVVEYKHWRCCCLDWVLNAEGHAFILCLDFNLKSYLYNIFLLFIFLRTFSTFRSLFFTVANKKNYGKIFMLIPFSDLAESAYQLTLKNRNTQNIFIAGIRTSYYKCCIG